MLDRIVKLRDAVKFAREEANSTDTIGKEANCWYKTSAPL